MFLSGRTKYLAAGASVGLHSASYADGRADPEATDLMAAYLRERRRSERHASPHGAHRTEATSAG